MAYIAFDSNYAPCGFLIVRDGKYHRDEDHTTLIQSDWDYPGVASRIGWVPCECGKTDGTVDCRRCGRSVSKMISEAYDFLLEHEGENFDALDDYFPEE